MTTTTSTIDLSAYTAEQVAAFVIVDFYAVRAEGLRRKDAASKEIDRLRQLIAAAQCEMADSEIILKASFSRL